MAVSFFGVLTPAALILRWAGSDLLRLRIETAISSYWIGRTSNDDQQTSMTRQF